jgi:hypothetical protein
VRQMREGFADEAPGSKPPERVVPADSAVRVLLAAASRALRGLDCADLGRHSMLSRLPGTPEPVRRAAAVRAAGRGAVPAAEVVQLDAERIARWMVGHYPLPRYPGLVLGSPHGAAVHLATAMGVPWLPAAFELAVRWPGGAVDDPAGALADGGGCADRLVSGNPGIRIRQVYDPLDRGVLAGATLTLMVHWRRLPEAYRWFVADRLDAGAAVLLVRDVRNWPAWRRNRGHSFQIGTAAIGAEPAECRPGTAFFDESLRAVGGDRYRWRDPLGKPRIGAAECGVDPGFVAELLQLGAMLGRPVHRALLTRSEALSAAVADVYRRWLRAAGKTGDRCVIECGRLLDPWQVVRAGLVPYWCENASGRSVTAAEWWLAGSAPFSSVDVLPDPPGVRRPGLAGLPQWLAVASFGRRRRAVDRGAARGYPGSRVPTRRATEVLRAQPCDLPVPDPLRFADALSGLREYGAGRGLVLC